MTRSWKALTLTVGTAALTGFTTAPNTPAPADPGPPAPPTVTVDNARSVPASVYLDQGPFDIRLGTVAPHAKATLTLPSWASERTVQVFVQPKGENDLESQDLNLSPGQNVDIYVPTNDVGYVPSPPPEVIPNPGLGTTTVTVQNRRAHEVSVFIEHGDEDIRIGRVPANQEVTLSVPEWLVRTPENVQVLLEPANGLDLTSEWFDLHKGAHLLVKVPV